MSRPSNGYSNNSDQTTRSLEQTRAEKEKTLADLAAGEEQAARKTHIPHRHP